MNHKFLKGSVLILLFFFVLSGCTDKHKLRLLSEVKKELVPRSPPLGGEALNPPEAEEKVAKENKKEVSVAPPAAPVAPAEPVKAPVWSAYDEKKRVPIKTTKALQAELNQSEKVVLEGTYQLTGDYILIPSNRVIDSTNAVFIGEGHFVTSFADKMTWHGGTFEYQDRGINTGLSFQLWRSTNLTFESMTFNHNNLSQHHFDLLGASFVNITGCSFNGYNLKANSLSTTEKPHNSYAESIQIDYAYAKGIGGIKSQNYIRSVSKGKYVPYDDTPTHDVKIYDCTFTDLEGEKTQYPVGQHVMPRMQGSIYNIHVKNAIFNVQNLVPPNFFQTNGELSYPWHFGTDRVANNIVIE